MDNEIVGYIRKVGWLALKDIRMEMRSRELVTTMFTFGAMVAFIFGFALDAAKPQVRQLFPGVLWATFALASVIVLGRSLRMERENDALLGLMLMPVDRSAIYFGKVLGNLLIILLVEVLTLPLIALLFSAAPPPEVLPQLALLLFTGTLGLTLIGTLLSSLTLNLRASEVLLPVLLFPMLVPVILGTVRATETLLARGALVDEAALWMQILIAYDALFGVLSFMFFEYTLET